MKQSQYGSGSIQPRGKDTYRIFVSAGVDDAGKRIRKSITIKGSYRDAERAMRQLQYDLENNGVSSSMQLDAWVSRWLEDIERTRAPRTVAEYRRMLTIRILPALGSLRLDQLQPKHLAQFLKHLAMAPHSRRDGNLSGHSQLKYYRLLSVILQEAVYQGLLSQNPVRQVRPPKMERYQAKYYDQQQISRLWMALQVEPLIVQVVIGTALLLGIRRGELIGLRWEDIDFEQNGVSIRQAAYKIRGKKQAVKAPKTTGSARTIPLPTPLREILLRWRALQRPTAPGYICTDEAGRWLHVDTPTRMMQAFVQRHGLSALNLHGLRHTAATAMLEAGVPLRAVSEHLGHGQASTTTNVYSHATLVARAMAGTALANAVQPKTTDEETK